MDPIMEKKTLIIMCFCEKIAVSNATTIFLRKPCDKQKDNRNHLWIAQFAICTKSCYPWMKENTLGCQMRIIQ